VDKEESKTNWGKHKERTRNWGKHNAIKVNPSMPYGSGRRL
jgi:hypothetical protein